MTKEYRASGFQLSMSVVINGRRYPVKFSPVSTYEDEGGSFFATSDAIMQEALEKSPRFGVSFKLYKINGIKVSELAEPTEEKADEVIDTISKSLTTVKVDSLPDAKEYLHTHFDWKPKGIVTKKRIIDAAATFGVSFEGI